MHSIRVIGFDADDTLWHSETLFQRIHERYRALLSTYHGAETVDRALIETERRNLALYGYGVKGFTLSAIETAIDLTGGKIGTGEIRAIMDSGREMLAHPVQLLEGVSETIATLAQSHRLILITKGDLRHQESKVANSGLAPHFQHIEIVSEKDRETYRALLRKLGVEPEEFLMAGNSLKSDILPVLELGGAGALIPYPLLWELEQSGEKPPASERFFELKNLNELLSLLASPA